MKVVLGDVAVVVKDAKASAKWWKEKCGFEIRDSVGHWITVAPPGPGSVVIHLCEGHPAEQGNTGIGFFVDEVAAIEKAWTKKGVTFSLSRKVGEASVQAKFLDPDGNEYWLFEDEDLREAPKKKAKPKPAAKKARKAPARKPAAKRRAR